MGKKPPYHGDPRSWALAYSKCYASWTFPGLQVGWFFMAKFHPLVEDVGFSVGWRNNKFEKLKYWCFFFEAWQPISSQCWPSAVPLENLYEGWFSLFWHGAAGGSVWTNGYHYHKTTNHTHFNNVFSSIFCPLTTETSLTIFLALVFFLQPCGSVCDDSIFPKESIGEGTTPWWSLETDLVGRHGCFPFKRNNCLYLMSIQD